MKKILTIGGATQDIFIFPENLKVEFLSNLSQSCILMQEGSKIEVTAVRYLTGGGATNSAVSFKRLGFDVATIVKLGQDVPAQKVIEELDAEGVVTRHIIHSSEGSTGISFIIPTPSGDRTILAYRGINAKLHFDDIPFEIFKTFDQLYITSLSGNASQFLTGIVKQAKKYNIPVATNPGTSQLIAGADILKEALPYIDVLILNADETIMLMNSLMNEESSIIKKTHVKNGKELPLLLRDPMKSNAHSFWLIDYCKEILRRGPKIVCITNGAEGVYVAHQDSIFFCHSIKTKIVNSLGAGDAFGSCFVASLALKYPISKAIMHGVVNASSVISQLGAKTGLLTLQELELRTQSIGLSVKTFDLQ